MSPDGVEQNFGFLEPGSTRRHLKDSIYEGRGYEYLIKREYKVEDYFDATFAEMLLAGPFFVRDSIHTGFYQKDVFRLIQEGFKLKNVEFSPKKFFDRISKNSLYGFNFEPRDQIEGGRFLIRHNNFLSSPSGTLFYQFYLSNPETFSDQNEADLEFMLIAETTNDQIPTLLKLHYGLKIKKEADNLVFTLTRFEYENNQNAIKSERMEIPLTPNAQNNHQWLHFGFSIAVSPLYRRLGSEHASGIFQYKKYHELFAWYRNNRYRASWQQTEYRDKEKVTNSASPNKFFSSLKLSCARPQPL